MTLQELTPWLFSRGSGGIRWGLERTEELLAGVGDPHRHFRAIHVGGTNGKGSVAAMCDRVLRSEGALRIGLYTSPHLISFSERIRVGGEPITDEALLSAAERLRPGVERTGATFFEATTAIAFLAFAEARVDLAVVEVGLGGRLDATNVLRPEASGVTNVGFDHAEYLGEDLRAIAAEKAGIIKPGVPFLSGVADGALGSIFRGRAAEVGAPFLSLDEAASVRDVTVDASTGTSFEIDSRRWGRRSLTTGLAGRHQARNAAFAMELLGLLPEEIRPTQGSVEEGLREVRWPGRLQVESILGCRWVFDVAHNADGANALVAALRELHLPEPRVMVVGILADKDWREMLGTLAPGADAVILTQPESAPRARVWEPRDAEAWLREAHGVRARVIPEIGAAIQRASTLAPHGTVIVTGSIHTVGDAMRYLGVASV